MTSCPACSSKRSSAHQVDGVRVCRKCGAVFTERAIYLGESYGIVLPYWHEGDETPETNRYFDLECLGSKGIERRHGWFDTRTRKIVQTG